MKKGKMKYRALPYALLSLQFWRDDAGLKFTYTVNDGNLIDGFFGVDYPRWGKQFAETDLLNFNEKQRFANFCRAYLEYLKDRP